jgi:hypothetical protein
MTDSASSPTTNPSQEDTVCKETEPHHHHRHHHHLPPPQIIYVVANQQDIPVNAYQQTWPSLPPTIAPIQANPISPAPLASPVIVHPPSTAASQDSIQTSSPPASQPATACKTIVDDCCEDCCPVAAQGNKPPSADSSLNQQWPLPLPYALRPPISHHYQSLRPIAPYTMPAAPPPRSSMPVALAISDFLRQHNAFTHYPARLSTPQTQHGQRQSLTATSKSAPSSPTIASHEQETVSTNQQKENTGASNETQANTWEDQHNTDTDAVDTASSSLATLSEAAVAIADKDSHEIAGQKRKLDEQQGEARCLWAACAAVFKCIDDLILHLNKLHVGSKSIKTNNQCRWEACQTAKEDTDDLISHLCQDHLGAPELKHGCHWKGCETRFESFDDLTGHLSERHIGTGKSQYVCSWEECERQGRAFTQRQKVMRHIQTHTGKKGLNLLICTVIMTLRYTHMLTLSFWTNSGDKPYQCNICNKRFSEANIMTQHMRRHTGEKPYRCPEAGCTKEFSISGALTIHKRVHSGEKPFQCRFEGCDKRFAESSNLTKHVSEKLEKAFYLPTMLLTSYLLFYFPQTRVHTGERPFKCSLPSCDRRFPRPDQLSRHEKTHKVK